MGSGFAQGVEPLPCSFLPLFHVPGPIDRGAWLFVAFLALVENPAEGGGGGWATSTRPLPGKPGSGHVLGPRPLARPQNAAAPRMAAPILPAPPGNRSSAGGEALAEGRVGTLGCAGGRRRFAAWAAKRKKGSRRQSLRLPFLGRYAPPPPPPAAGSFAVLSDGAPVFTTQNLPTKLARRSR